MTPTAPPPRYWRKRCRMKPRWISSRTPPAIIATSRISPRRGGSAACLRSGFCGTLCSCGAIVKSTPRTSSRDHEHDRQQREADDRFPHDRPVAQQHVAHTLAMRAEEQDDQPNDEPVSSSDSVVTKSGDQSAVRRLQAHPEACHHRQEKELGWETRSTARLRRGRPPVRRRGPRYRGRSTSGGSGTSAGPDTPEL